MTPPRGVHCTENSSVKGPVTPNLCIPRDHCRALSCLTSHSLRTALGRAARALTTGVSGSRAHPVPCCPPWAISREEGACHTCGAAPADSRTVSSSRGCCAAGLASQAERGRGPGRRGVPSGEDPFPQGKAHDLAGEDQEGPGRFSWTSLALWASSTGHATWGLWLSL